MQTVAAQKLSVMTTEKSHLEDEIKMLQQTYASSLRTELEGKEVANMYILKGGGDRDATGRVAKIKPVLMSNPKESDGSKR